MIRYLLDTNIISEPARPQPASSVLERLQANSARIAIPSVVWHELLYGVVRLPEGQRRNYLASYVLDVVRSAFPILPYDDQAGNWHALERARLEGGGYPTSFADGMIAAVAATRELILVTRNTKDFARFDGLHLENWFEQG